MRNFTDNHYSILFLNTIFAKIMKLWNYIKNEPSHVKKIRRCNAERLNSQFL